jgi:hypothetical protein
MVLTSSQTKLPEEDNMQQPTSFARINGNFQKELCLI